MAEVTTGYPFRKGRAKYDFPRLMDGQQWVLHRGTERQFLSGERDFAIEAAKYRSTLCGWAWRHNLHVTTSVLDESTVVAQYLGEK